LIPHDTTYTNKHGHTFDFRVERIKLPEQANFWKYFFFVEERSTHLKSQHRCGTLKSHVTELVLADSFVLGDPLNYLKRSLLDEFDASDGTTPLYWPELSTGWFVV